MLVPSLVGLVKDRGENNERSGNGGGRLETRKDVRCMYILIIFGLRHHSEVYTLVARRMHDSTICYCRRAALPVTSGSCSKQLIRQCFVEDN